MKRLMTSTAIAALVAFPVWAQTTTADPDTSEELSEAGSAVVQEVEEGAEDVAQATGDAAQSVEEGTEELATDAAQGVENAGEEIAQEAEELEAEAEGEMTAEGEAMETETDTIAVESTTAEPDATVTDMDAEVVEGDDMMEADGDNELIAAEGWDMEREGYTTVAIDQITAEKLDGARVYDANDEWIGEVGELILDGDQISQAVVDVGGFLGLGEKHVALKMSDLNIQQEADGEDIRVFVPQSKEQLEEMPEYES